MNKERVAGLILITLLAAWLVLRSCVPEEPPPEPASPPTREAFHASRPLRLEVAATQDAANADLAWLELELRQLLSRGKMRVAPVDAAPGEATFTLRITSDGQRAAGLALVAPDGIVDKQEQIQADEPQRLALISAIAHRLPAFLNAAHASEQWVDLIGTRDSATYESFLAASKDVLGPGGAGFTHPLAAPRARNVDRLEALTRSQPKFARAWGLLSAAYLSVGGQDERSLTQLAETSAERALLLDADLPEATGAQGLVHARRNEWIAARDRFERALQVDANSIVALEGLACLLVDVGDGDEARPYAVRAVALQPANIGAQECLAYAADASASTTSPLTSPPAVRVAALRALLANEVMSARESLRTSLPPQEYEQWAQPLLEAAENRKRVPHALRAVTRSASESSIDASTEIFAGAALRQADFVLNRMSRLQRQREQVPLRVLWMPQTQFLRRHSLFHDIVDDAGLPAYWQEHGVPDICASEPRVYGCKARGTRPAASSR